MSETDKIARVIVAAVRSATSKLVAQCADLQAKVTTLEERAPVPGPPGEKGDPGPRGDGGANGRDGLDGKDGRDGSDAAIGTLPEQVARLERETEALTLRMTAIDTVQLSDEELVSLCDDLTRKAFGALPSAAPVRRMQKRVIRDGEGRIERVVDEPVGP